MRRQRLAGVIALMKYSDSTIKEIAATTGFKSLQAFNQFIQRECQTSPRSLHVGIRTRKAESPLITSR